MNPSIDLAYSHFMASKKRTIDALRVAEGHLTKYLERIDRILKDPKRREKFDLRYWELENLQDAQDRIRNERAYVRSIRRDIRKKGDREEC